MTENLGKCDYDEEIRKRTKMIFVPNWFSVDLKVGVSDVHRSITYVHLLLSILC
jgi:hypothetical protein